MSIMPNDDPRPSAESMESVQPWERIHGETSRSYDAFCAFRDAGPMRKMDAVWRRYESERGRVVAEHRRCASSWWEWYKRFDWKVRAERYDAHLEFQSRQLHESQHREKINAHLERQRQIAVACQSVSLRMLQVVQKELQRVVGDNGPGSHTLDPKKLAPYVRSAAVLASISSDHEASALGIDELLGVLNESEATS